MSAEEMLARHLEGKFFLIDGTDKNEDMRRAAEYRGSERAARVEARRQLMAREAARKKLTLERLAHGTATPAFVVAAVAYAHAVPIETIVGPSRERKVVAARQHAFHVMKEKLDLGYSEIGRYMGRDHSTVMHGCGSWHYAAKRHQGQVDVVLDLLGYKVEAAA
jgi:hypothetical protein